MDEDDILVDREALDAWQTQQFVAAPKQTGGQSLRTPAELPGPPGIPLLGNLAQLTHRQNHLVQEKWSEQYGPIICFRLAQWEFVAFADSESVNRVLRERPGIFRRVGFLEPISREIGVHGVFFAEGEEWRRYRRLAMEALSVRHLRQYFPTLDTVLQRLERHCNEAARTGLALDIQRLLMRFIVDVTTNLVFGLAST